MGAPLHDSLLLLAGIWPQGQAKRTLKMQLVWVTDRPPTQPRLKGASWDVRHADAADWEYNSRPEARFKWVQK